MPSLPSDSTRPARALSLPLFACLALASVAATPVTGQTGAQLDAASAEIFRESCADCHSNAQSGRTPSRASISALSPRAVVAALTDGAMRAEGEDLTPEQRIGLAEYLTRREYEAEVLPESAYCSVRGPDGLDLDEVRWMGFGNGPDGRGFQSAAAAGIAAEDVGDLELKWAFGIPSGSQVRTKPTVIGDQILIGDQYGYLYALEAESGCVRWTYLADSALRGAILVESGSAGEPIAYFSDFRTNAYALDIESGELLWKTRVGWHPESAGTGSPILYDDFLIVPISSMEVARAASPGYECCTSSGAVAAVSLETGTVEWYHRVIEGYPDEAGENGAGTQLWAPAGAPVWSSPTVDGSRGLVYIGTGENYTIPTTSNSDAIVAVDLGSGVARWTFQGTPEDAWTMACGLGQGRGAGSCPTPMGPDFDFPMAPMIVERADGSELLVAGQKSGYVWGLDPDDGSVVWSTQVGKGGALGGIHWGMAADGRMAYAANADRAFVVDVHPDFAPSPGLYALDLMTGDVVWSTPAPRDTCEGKQRCYAANSAAPTVIPGVVFAGGLDGVIRAYSTDDGTVLWDFDTVREYETVNGVPGRGGAIDGPGPVVADGILYVNSGYGSFGQMPGNVLLAFEVGR